MRVAAEVSPQATAAAIGRLLERAHAGADDFDLIVPEALLEQSQRPDGHGRHSGGGARAAGIVPETARQIQPVR